MPVILILVYISGLVLRIVACFRAYYEEVEYFSKYSNYIYPWIYRAPTKRDLIKKIASSPLWPLSLLFFPFDPKSFFQYFHIGKSEVLLKLEKEVLKQKLEEKKRKLEIENWLRKHTPSKLIKYSTRNGAFIFRTKLISRIIHDQSNFMVKWAKDSNDSLNAPVDYPDFAPNIRVQVYDLVLNNKAAAHCKVCNTPVEKLKKGSSGGAIINQDGYETFRGQTYESLYCENNHLLIEGKEGPRFF